MKEKQATSKAKSKSFARSRKRPRTILNKTKEMSHAQAVKAMYEDSDRTLLPKFRRYE